MTAAELLALAERVEGLTEADPEVEADVWLAFEPGATRRKWSYVHKASGDTCEVDETRDGAGRLVTVPCLTTSRDAVVRLIEQVMPGRARRTGKTLGRLKRRLGATEIRRCDIYGRRAALTEGTKT